MTEPRRGSVAAPFEPLQRGERFVASDIVWLQRASSALQAPHHACNTCMAYAPRFKPVVMAKVITPHDARTIAAAAFCDPRSVVKAIEGKPLAALTMARIRAALAQLGRAELLPAAQQPVEGPRAA